MFGLPDKWDLGRVFILSGNLTSPAANRKEVFQGKVIGGRFGTAVAYLGDLNHDKFGGACIYKREKQLFCLTVLTNSKQ